MKYPDMFAALGLVAANRVGPLAYAALRAGGVARAGPSAAAITAGSRMW